jgi:hypothetical protein
MPAFNDPAVQWGLNLGIHRNGDIDTEVIETPFLNHLGIGTQERIPPFEIPADAPGTARRHLLFQFPLEVLLILRIHSIQQGAVDRQVDRVRFAVEFENRCMPDSTTVQ